MLRNGTCILLYLKCQNTPPAERHLCIIQKPANWSLQLRKHEKSYENMRMIPVILRIWFSFYYISRSQKTLPRVKHLKISHKATI